MTTHSDLIAASDAIGGIAQSACWYTQRLAAAIQERNVSVEDLTVRDLILLDRQVRAEVAQEYARALV